MKAGIQAIIMKINEDADEHSNERYAQIKDAVDCAINDENSMYQEESNKQREVLKKHSEHEYLRRLEYQRSRLNRELLVCQHELTGEIFDQAVSKLRDTSNDEFSAMLKSAVKGLKGAFTLHPGALSCEKLDSRAIKEAENTSSELTITLSDETIPHKSGFVLRDDRVEYNHLFEDLVEDMKNERAATIMKDIFGNSGDWMLT